jgi:hypothetical protein
MFHRYFRGKVDELVMTMEQESLKMVEVMQGLRENEYASHDDPSQEGATEENIQ